MINVTVKLPKEVADLVKKPGKTLEIAVQEKIILELYREGVISFGKTAELLGMSKWDFIDFLREQEIPLDYTEEDLKEDLKTLEELK